MFWKGLSQGQGRQRSEYRYQGFDKSVSGEQWGQKPLQEQVKESDTRGGELFGEVVPERMVEHGTT